MKFISRASVGAAQMSNRGRRSTGQNVAIVVGVTAVAIVTILALLGGGNPARMFMSAQAESGQTVEDSDLTDSCATVADIDENPDCRFVVYFTSMQAVWSDLLRSGYQPATATFVTGGVSTACGSAPPPSGPFYCPDDRGIYLDLDFFGDLRSTHRGQDFADAYVLGHEYGHHVQHQISQHHRVADDSDPDSAAVRFELQADCYAGVWAYHANRTDDADGRVLLPTLTRADIAAGLSAATIVGESHIQQPIEGAVSPETWAHGSSEQRQRWFLVGYRSGSPRDCDTFATGDL